MDREYVLEILIAVIGGLTLVASGWWPAHYDCEASGQDRERVAWKRVWLPLVPLAVSVAWLIGWALVEPEPTEVPPVALFVAAVPFVTLFTRATTRALRSLAVETREHGAATVGVLRPRILIAPRLADALEDRELEAVLEHERAHARHLDPLRLWLAQLATDLQWPWPQARWRFRAWIHALELARDEEARLSGVDGADLAAAIVAAIRLGQTAVSPAIATLTGDASLIEERIAHLLQPLDVEGPDACGRFRLITLTALLLAIAVLLGSEYGEPIIRGLLSFAA